MKNSQVTRVSKSILAPWKPKQLPLALLNVDPGSKHRMAQIERNLQRLTAQSPAQSRMSSEVRLGCSGLNAIEFWKSQDHIPQPLWVISSRAQLPLYWKSAMFQLMTVSCSSTTRIKNLISQFPLSQYQKVTIRYPLSCLASRLNFSLSSHGNLSNPTMLTTHQLDLSQCSRQWIPCENWSSQSTS